MQISRRGFCGAASALALSPMVGAANGAVKVGVLTDMSGPMSSVLGQGSVLGARIAVEEFGGSVAGMPAQVVFADHQGKPDVGSNVARRWFDEEGVDIVVDLGNSAIALAVQAIAKEKNKMVIASGAGSGEITGKYCNRNTFQWAYDTYMQSAPVASEMTRLGGDTWFFITADYTFGNQLEADARRRIEQLGARVVGGVKVPVNTLDYSSFLLQARASGAKMIGIALTGDDLERVIRQGAEFNMWSKQRAAAFAMQLYNIPAIGLGPMKGVLHNSIFVWDRTPATRAFSKRFFDVMRKPPSEAHATCYSAVLTYLKAVRAAGTNNADAVIKAFNDLPVEDVVSPKGYVRKDGRLIRPTFLTEVKPESEVKNTWDLLTIRGEIPGEQAFRPLSESACPAAKT